MRFLAGGLIVVAALVGLCGCVTNTNETNKASESKSSETNNTSGTDKTRIQPSAGYVRVAGPHFVRDDKPYYIAGANLWYAAYLGAPNAVGNRERLRRELDSLQAMSINNLRVLAVSEQSATQSAVKPAVINGFGQFDENLLQGLDYLLVELAKRDMTAVLYLNNFWQWSGGMTQYMNWIDGEPVRDPNVTGDYEQFIAKSASFYQSARAQEEFRKVIKKIVTRTNTLTGTPYINDPVIMSWQLANEPRPGNKKTTESEKVIYLNWVRDTANYIHSLDTHHLVSTGSEGLKGSAEDEALFMKVHALPAIDYATYHLWARNWSWIDQFNMAGTWDQAMVKVNLYVNRHIDLANRLQKPIVLEEFGLDRDNGSFDRSATTVYRDRFYRELLGQITRRAQAGEAIAGFNFWAWNGMGRTTRSNYWWREGDDLMGDPPQEQQGMYGVFDTDVSTIAVIKEYAQKIQQIDNPK